jgi:hypothetical protein
MRGNLYWCTLTNTNLLAPAAYVISSSHNKVTVLFDSDTNEHNTEPELLPVTRALLGSFDYCRILNNMM